MRILAIVIGVVLLIGLTLALCKAASLEIKEEEEYDK